MGPHHLVDALQRSQAGRLADGAIYMHAGLEIGVAATKTFT